METLSVSLISGFIPSRVPSIGGGMNSDANRAAGRLPHDCRGFRGVFSRRAISETRQIPAHIDLCQDPPNPKTLGSLLAGLRAECRRSLPSKSPIRWHFRVPEHFPASHMPPAVDGLRD